LRFGVNDHDIDRFVGLGIKSIFQENFGTEDYLAQKAEGVGQLALALAKPQ
jgi:hypothetical protein